MSSTASTADETAAIDGFPTAAPFRVDRSPLARESTDRQPIEQRHRDANRDVRRHRLGEARRPGAMDVEPVIVREIATRRHPTISGAATASRKFSSCAAMTCNLPNVSPTRLVAVRL